MIDVILLKIKTLVMIQFTGPSPFGVITSSNTRKFHWALCCAMERELKHLTKLRLLIFPNFSFQSCMVPLLHPDTAFSLLS